MNPYSYEKESRAYQAWERLRPEAEAARRLFDDAEIPLPPALARFFQISTTQASVPSAPRLHVPPEPQPSVMPPENHTDWIWIPANELGEQSLVLAILSEASAPLSSKVVYERVRKFNHKAVAGTILNIGTRLDGKLIERGESGWTLIDTLKAPAMFGDKAWGPPGVFQKQDIAQYRRRLIVHILSAQRSGLMIVQIVELLAQLDDKQVPANKDLVKMDIAALMKAGRIKRVGNSRKYTRTTDAKD
jgi:hypothetical protein